ncbi:MAG: hypothetical protein COU30_00285, partial [Candidatus Magasanikbacteria bacterium CG10_big_fil_rev_8_21_14_0_10_38_6]
MIENIFLQISILLGITVSIAFIVRLLRQPLMIAYIVAGIIAGPVFLNVIHGDSSSFQAFAELGVVLLLFLVGLSLDFKYIRRVGKVAVVAGVGQVLFTGVIGWLLLTALGLGTFEALYLSIAITFSSTIIIIKLLSDKQDLESVYGRFTVGLLLVQDVIAITVMILFKTFFSGNGTWGALSIFLLKGGVLVAVIYFLARVLLPPLLNKVANSGEFLFLFTIAWCFGISSLVYWFGFSLEIGAVMAGISLGSSKYSLEIGSKIRPLRDFFIVLFFIILGSEMGVGNISVVLGPGLLLSLFILVGNPLILFVLFRVMRFTRRNCLLIGLTAAQVSEFGFILLFTGQQEGFVSDESLTLFTFVALVTIFISSYVVSYNEQLYRLLKPLFDFFGKDKYQQQEDVIEKYDVWVIGYHRIGWRICDELKAQGKKFAVIDYNPLVVDKAKHLGIPVYFGDVADVEFLSQVPLEKAKMIISTIHEEDDQLTLIRNVRDRSQKPYIIATLF